MATERAEQHYIDVDVDEPASVPELRSAPGDVITLTRVHGEREADISVEVIRVEGRRIIFRNVTRQ